MIQESRYYLSRRKHRARQDGRLPRRHRIAIGVAEGYLQDGEARSVGKTNGQDDIRDSPTDRERERQQGTGTSGIAGSIPVYGLNQADDPKRGNSGCPFFYVIFLARCQSRSGITTGRIFFVFPCIWSLKAYRCPKGLTVRHFNDQTVHALKY